MFLGPTLDRNRREPAPTVVLFLVVGLAWLVVTAATAQACEIPGGTEARDVCRASDVECGASSGADGAQSDGCCPSDGGECTAACCAAGAAMMSGGVPSLSFAPIAPVAPSSPTAPLFPESPSLDHPPRS